MSGFKNFIMRGNLVELAAPITPGTEQPQPARHLR